MWHEARKQERRIRGMIVDYRKRAERRQDFYERIQADPTQFIQVHGRRCKIHLDPAVAAAGDGAAIIVPWQGHQDNLIDRFDVRAHLDIIPPVPRTGEVEGEDITTEERQCNYERYRILAQNDFLSVTEEKFLHQLYLEEQFGANAQLEAERSLGKKKHQKPTGATIGYSYDETESSIGPQPFSHLMNVTLQSSAPLSTGGGGAAKSEKGSDSDSESDIDMDVAIEISKLDTTQAHELNGCGRNYGMLSNDFYSFLTKDVDEAEAMRMAREEEQEKMLLSGRKSRRERRAQKERRIACRPFSPPSYAAKEDSAAVGKKANADESDSRSPSPADANTGKITYITSFGGEDELQPHSKISININKSGTQAASTLGGTCAGTLAAVGQATYAQKVKDNLDKLKQLNESFTSRHNRARSRSGNQSRKRKSYSRSYSRSRSRERVDRRDFRRVRRDSRSSSNERLRHRSRHSRTRSRSRLRSRSPRLRRRYSCTSSSSSTSTTSTNSSARSRRREKREPSRTFKHGQTSDYRSRSRTKSRTRSRSPARSTKTPVPAQTRVLTKQDTVTTNPIKDVKPVSTVPMISYPLPLRVMGIEINVPPPPPSPAIVHALSDVAPAVQVAPPPPLKRYYGRKRGDGTSSSESDTEESNVELPDAKTAVKSGTGEINEDIDERMDVDTNSERSNPLPASSLVTSSGTPQTGKYSSTTMANNPSFSNASETKGGSSSIIGNRLNLRERLKRKMQNLLNKQYKADKRAEIEKSERERQLQQERDDEMRELALKLRRRQRELRHKYGTPNSSKASDSDASEPVAGSEPQKSRRSPSRTSEIHSIPSATQGEELKKNQQSTHASEMLVSKCSTHTQPHRSDSRDYERDRKRSRSRGRSRSRSRSCFRATQQRRSRSRSRGRRSASRRRRRSPSRTCRGRGSSYERSSSRYAAERTRSERHSRRSRSHNERSNYRDKDRDRERDRERFDRDKDRERNRDWQRDRDHERNRGREREHDRNRDRDHDRYRNREMDRDRNKDQRAVISGSSSSTQAVSSGSRNRIVISAPPKLKKLVDY